VIGCVDCLRNDLDCAGCGAKLYSNYLLIYLLLHDIVCTALFSRHSGQLLCCWLAAVEMELEASVVQPPQLSMADPDVQFCVYMINKYGDNYVVSCTDANFGAYCRIHVKSL